jgi:hypothetical protein
MGFSPRLDALAVFRPAEMAFIVRLLQPAPFSLRLYPAGGRRPWSSSVGGGDCGDRVERTPCDGGTCVWRGVSSLDSKSGANSTESSSTGGTKNRRGREANEASPNKMKKSFCVKPRRKSAVRHPVFKPVDLPELQIGDDSPNPGGRARAAACRTRSEIANLRPCPPAPMGVTAR